MFPVCALVLSTLANPNRDGLLNRRCISVRRRLLSHPVVKTSPCNVLAGDRHLPVINLGVQYGHDVRMPARPQPHLRFLADKVEIRGLIQREFQRDADGYQSRDALCKPHLAGGSTSENTKERIGANSVAGLKHLAGCDFLYPNYP